MAGESDLICDVQEREFEERVIRASSERPVLVDFWAPWCAPCKMLSPALEGAVESLGGAVSLAKVNVDNAPGVASEYGIRGIPAVKAFRDGRVVAEFVGLRGEADIREFLSGLLPSEADELAAEAAELAAAGRVDGAAERYRAALEESPRHGGALLGLAGLAMRRGDLQEARDTALSVQPGSPEHEGAGQLVARVRFMEECRRLGGRESAEQALKSTPDDLDAAFALAVCLAAAGEYEQALDRSLRIIERQKDYGGGAAKDAMVSIFSIVGQRSRLADEYRARLARALY